MYSCLIFPFCLKLLWQANHLKISERDLTFWTSHVEWYIFFFLLEFVILLGTQYVKWCYHKLALTFNPKSNCSKGYLQDSTIRLCLYFNTLCFRKADLSFQLSYLSVRKNWVVEETQRRIWKCSLKFKTKC